MAWLFSRRHYRGRKQKSVFNEIKFPFLGIMAVCAYHIFKLNCLNNVFYM